MHGLLAPAHRLILIWRFPGQAISIVVSLSSPVTSWEFPTKFVQVSPTALTDPLSVSQHPQKIRVASPDYALNEFLGGAKPAQRRVGHELRPRLMADMLTELGNELPPGFFLQDVLEQPGNLAQGASATANG
jgi:hypothetical protein